MNPFFEESDATLYKGDCVEIIKKIKPAKIDMVFADPPYFLSDGTITCSSGEMVSVKKGDWDIGGTFKKNVDFHRKWIKSIRTILSDNGTIWISGTYHSIYQCGYVLQELGFHILNDISWFKPNASPNLSIRYFTASHETLLWAKKSKGAKHTFNYEEVVNWEERYEKDIYAAEIAREPETDIFHNQGKQMRSVWSIPSPPKKEKRSGRHPTQKPLQLLERVVLSSTKPSDVVLDPFCGSSTTGIAALKYGRKYIGIDSEEEYVQLSKKRIENFLENKQEFLDLGDKA
jgi:site-specific DNA-methyltransferase (adenine-specific)